MQDKSVISIGCLRTLDHFLAGAVGKKEIESPFFKMHTVPMNSLEHLSDLLCKEEIQGAFIPLPLAMELFRSGLKIKLLLFANRGGGSIIKNNAACIENIEDFKDKTILTPCLLSVQNMLLHRMFFTAGLKLGTKNEKRTDIVLEVVPSNIVPDILENDSDNDIGGFVAPEPFCTRAVKTGKYEEMCKFDSLWQDHPDSGFVLQESVIRNNPEGTADLVSLFLETCKIIDQGDDNSLISYAETFFRQNHEIIVSLFPEIQRMFSPQRCLPDYSSLEIIQDYLVNQACWMNEKIDIKDFIDKHFVEKLRRELTNLENRN